MNAYPVFRVNPQGRVLVPSEKAKKAEKTCLGYAKTEEVVVAEATEFVHSNGGDVSNRMLLLAYCKLQFGKYQGQHFKWLLENALGYAVYLASSINKDVEKGQNNLSANKLLFVEYVEQVPEMQDEIRRYRLCKAAQAEASRTGDDGLELLGFSYLRDSSRKEVFESNNPDTRAFVSAIMTRKEIRPNTLMAKFHDYVKRRQEQLTQPPRRTALGTAVVPRLQSFVARAHRLPADVFLKKLAALETTGTATRPKVSVTSPRKTPARAPPVSVDHPMLKQSKSCERTGSPCDVSNLSIPESTAPRGHTRQNPAGSTPDLPSMPAWDMDEDDDQELVSILSHFEAVQGEAGGVLEQPCSSQQPSTSAARVVQPAPLDPDAVLHESPFQVELPGIWKQQLPLQQHEWIRKALFKLNAKTGKLELTTQLKMWWYPPQPALVHSKPPSPGVYFCRPLFLWMPLRMWSFHFTCINPKCTGHKLTSAGVNKSVRHVLDIDGWYDMATEYLECKRCLKKFPAWSGELLNQLDIAHRSQFPAILTYRYSCDYRVLRLMRERTLGNSSTQLQKKLEEQHAEAWMQRVLQYLAACEPFAKSVLVERPNFTDPPALPPIPKAKWLLTVYARDVLTRLDELKAKVTSVYGSVLKMDSTKKVTKKLAGAAAKTAAWCTNIGNEHGQVLMSVLTAAEGHGLQDMAKGLMQRYREAREPAPRLMYVDRDCCTKFGGCMMLDMFSEWTDLTVRLDIWHFMRRISAGCTTESHQLFGVFMARLSACIFEWDSEDVANLRRAKRSELARRKIVDISEEALTSHISRRELALHCRRKTRGVEETTRRIQSLVDVFDSENGKDTLGVPLLDHDRIQKIWSDQKKHIPCIQDPEDCPLYTKTSTLKKGDVELNCYRCARGSTSLESFHLHLNRFIPGTSASDSHFQAYLLEGLVRWNEDRMVSAVASTAPLSRVYSGVLREVVNRMSQTVLGKPLEDHYRAPGRYTGECIGIEYLYSQTGKSLTPVCLNPDEADETAEAAVTDDEDEGFTEETIEDLTVPVLSEDDPTRRVRLSPPPSSSDSHPVCTSAHYSAVPPPCMPAVDLLHQSPTRTTGHAAHPVSDSEDEANVAGPDGAPGYDKVQQLASHLVSLRQDLFLSEKSVRDLCRLWTALPDSDKERVKYPPRHQAQLITGRFKSSIGSKKRNVTPGIDSVKRCFVGQHAGPAQWPSTSRLVEAVCVLLCNIHRSPTKKGGIRTPRWSLILRDYHHIRDLIIGNAQLMKKTTLQLFELNQRTLTQWFQKRESKQEVAVLAQGLPHVEPIPTAGGKLPVARELMVQPPLPGHEPLQFQLPENREGQAIRVRGRRPKQKSVPVVQPQPQVQPHPRPILPAVLRPNLPTVQLPFVPAGTAISPVPPTVVANPDGSSQMSAAASASLPSVSRFTERNRRRKALLEETGGDKRRKYERKVYMNKCSKCGQPKTKEFGHSRYGSETFCSQASEGQTIQQWLAQQRQRAQEKKGKDGND